MTRRKKIVLTASGYFLNILLFSVTYWIAWVNNPSNFIVNDQYNEQTVKPFFFYEDLPDTNTTSGKMMTARETNELVKPYYDALASLKNNQRHVDDLLLESKILDSLNHDKLMKSFDKNFDSYLKQQLSPYNKTKDSIEAAIHDYEKRKLNSSPNSSSYYQFDVAIAKLNVMLASNDVTINMTKYNAYDKSLKSMPLFYDDTLYQIANLLYSRIDTLEKRKGHFLEDIRDKKDKIGSIAANYYMNRVFKLGFSDFLYFSIITASSTGYGDILPNNSLIRNFVSIEILLSLFLFGFFFYFIAQRTTNDKKNESDLQLHSHDCKLP
jgi:hypothetical protein